LRTTWVWGPPQSGHLGGSGPTPNIVSGPVRLVVEKSFVDQVVAALLRTEVAGEIRDELAEEFRWEVVSHPRDKLQTRTGDGGGGRLPARRIDQGVGLTVDHQGGDADIRQRRGAVGLRHDRGELAGGAGRVESTIVGGTGSLSHGLLVEGEAG
jgi:hypothetical protein